MVNIFWFQIAHWQAWQVHRTIISDATTARKSQLMAFNACTESAISVSGHFCDHFIICKFVCYRIFLANWICIWNLLLLYLISVDHVDTIAIFVLYFSWQLHLHCEICKQVKHLSNLQCKMSTTSDDTPKKSGKTKKGLHICNLNNVLYTFCVLMLWRYNCLVMLN